ncbi:MFS transporter [Arthrobacter sp. NPDC055138]
MDIKARIEASPMTKAQVGIVAICLALNFIDGYDVLVMAFSATAITEAWGLSGSDLGILLSSALAGMTIGAIFVAQIADKIGRRKTIILATSVITLGMFASAMAPSYEVLLVLRILTGIAVGTMQTSLNVMVAEYANARRRATAVSIYAAGQPIGGVLGGIIVAALLTYFEWHAGFIFGGVITLAMLPIVIKWLPESIDYLNAKRPENALAEVNKVLVRLEQPKLDALPAAPDTTGRPKNNLVAVFANGQAKKTVLLAFAFMMIMGSFYFANSWTPRLLTESGYSANQGITAGVLFSVGAIIGAMVFAWAGARFPLKRTLAVFFVLAAVSFAVFALLADTLNPALMGAVLLGMLTNASIAGMFTIGPVYYDAAVRATAVGLIGGIGRCGGIISPILAGALVDAGWIPGNIYFVFVLPLVLGAVALLVLRKPASLLAPAATQPEVTQPEAAQSEALVESR